MTFAGESTHRCKCVGENDGPYGAWCACPPELCEADVLLARVTALKERAEAAEEREKNTFDRLESVLDERDRLAAQVESLRSWIKGSQDYKRAERLARQVADLEAALREIENLPGWPLPHKAIARAALVAARSRDPQEPQT